MNDCNLRLLTQMPMSCGLRYLRLFGWGSRSSLLPRGSQDQSGMRQDNTRKYRLTVHRLQALVILILVMRFL